MKYNNIWMVVPTYWGHRGTPDNPPCTQFDHPTSLRDAGTLGRTLESIMQQAGEFNVLLVVVGTHDNLFKQAHTTVRNIAEQHNQRKNVYLVSNNNYQRINEILKYPILRLDSYGSIRNVQLIFPILAGADLIIAIDDDEIIPDSNFVNQIAKTFYHARISDTPMYGGAGPYYSAAGDYHINEASIAKYETNLFLKKKLFYGFSG